MAVTQGHFLGLALYGTALWGSGAFAISLIPKTISDKRIGLPVIYAAIIPASAAMVAVIPKLVPGVGVLKGTAIAAAVAGLLDGFALAWAPKLYGQATGAISAPGSFGHTAGALLQPAMLAE